MAKIYISPSTQEHNAYAGGGNEEQWMRDICGHVVILLRAAGHVVRMGGTISAGTNARDANAWGAQWYIAVHSNAGGGVGTEGWYYTGSTNGKKIATAVYNRVAPVSSSPDRGVKTSTQYIELNATKAPSTIIEIDFHDKLANANEIKAKHEQYAKAIAQGVIDVAGGSVPTPPPPPNPTKVPVYRFRHKDGYHFWTASETERASVAKDANYAYEGIAFYASGG